MKTAILVNGVPASGKSTVSRGVAARLHCPLLALDTLKEPLFEHLGIGDREHNRKLGRASYGAIFALIGDWPDPMTVVVDAWFGFQPSDVLERHLATAGVGRTAELWCHAPGEVLAKRYRARLGQRAAGHPGEGYLPELVELSRRAEPLRRGPVFDMDTTRPIDFEAMLRWIGEVVGGDKTAGSNAP